MNSKYRNLFIAIFMLSLALRLGLTLVNREANDDHTEVVRIIMRTGQLPTMADCRECFHPKLYYAVAAGLLQLTNIQGPDAQAIFLQFVNFLAGLASLALLWKLIDEYPSQNMAAKAVVFALLALNPKFIAISSQASNDSFVILFCSLALFSAWRFLQKASWPWYWALVASLLLAVSTKATAWVIFCAVCLAFLLAAWATKKKVLLLHFALMAVCVVALTVVDPLSQFIVNYPLYHTPIPNSKPALPLPAFFDQSSAYKQYPFRPGIVSIQDGFFTFKLADLLSYPLLPVDGYPPFRTSFWTMLYADAQSLHIQNWPASWRTSGTAGFDLSRAIFIAGLWPALLAVAGFILEAFFFLKSLLARDLHPVQYGLFLAAVSGCMLFLLLCALVYRDFAFIKFIYILPGLLGFGWVLLRSASTLFDYLARYRWLTWLAHGVTVVLLILYTLDVTSMIAQLYTINIHF